MSQIQVTLKKSVIGRPEKQKVTVNSLGLRKINQSVQLEGTLEIRGMIQKVSHLVDISEISNNSPITETGKKDLSKEKVTKQTSAEKKVQDIAEQKVSVEEETSTERKETDKREVGV